ncbi:DUF4167 domain-containing protein [Amaricoccus solimangrovi]|uniref:DUF4167 domain-containing protein n=2 Tax=Amaricoccus solimangrovi TaxID=2589815 RepID=A0A501WU68_9RHOB|nr:DUF4167 domain-containing protein [Amaricoccus solimangrovi]
MRSSNKSRSRNKPGNNGQNNQRRPMGNIVNRVFESAGPDGKVRGTPQQIIDKYQALARDAQVSGDRVVAENYLQHSEHYSRLLGEAQRQQNEQRYGQDRDEGSQQRGEDQGSERAQQASGGEGGGERQQRDQRQGDQRQGGGQPPRQPRPVSGFGLQTFEPEEAEFGPIPTPENGDPQPRLSAPAADYQQPEGIGGDPRDASPSRAGQGAPSAETGQGEEAKPAPAAEAPARPEPAAEPEPVAPAEAAAPADAAPAGQPAAEPAAEAAPAKRPRTRRKPKAEGEEKPSRKSKAAAEAETPAPSDDAPEAQPAEQM